MLEMEVDNTTEKMSSGQQQQQEQQQQQKPTDAIYDPAVLPDMLPVYYKRLFPHKPFYRWLSYGLCKCIMFILFTYS